MASHSKRAKTEKSDFFFIDGETLSTSDVFSIVNNDKQITVSKNTKQKINASRSLLEEFINENRVIYGINTGCGGFVEWLIPNDQASKLQENLISAVATNVGEYLDDKTVKATMLSRLNSLARGSSAISLENYEKLLDIYNAGIIPCIPSKGSLGASGDLGPLACIALVATGKWKAKYKDQILPGNIALKNANISPMKLSFKEGLSLINGTSTMTGLASILVEQANDLIKTYDIISCLSFEGLRVKLKAFNPIVHRQKKHRGQTVTAENIWKMLSDSEMVIDEDALEQKLQHQRNSTPSPADTPIEDAYSIRCTPHILGPIRDSISSVQKTVNDELNSSSDNPLILSKEKEVFHNGHFHGQYISMAMDQLSIAITTLTNLSDRRIDRFMDKHNSNGLPAYLCAENPGLRLGLMGGQFMATSLTAENRSLCTPLSIQSLTSTGDFQDIVSMGLIAARRAKEILDNAAYVLAFELICAAQAVEIRGTHLLSKATRKAYEQTREIIPYLSSDECLTPYLEKVAILIKSGKLLSSLNSMTEANNENLREKL